MTASQDKTVPARPNPLHERNVNDERLANARAALARGDSRTARSLCRTILRSGHLDTALRHEVETLLKRTRVDALHVAILIGLIVSIAVILLVYVRS